MIPLTSSLYLHQAAMTSNKNTMSATDETLVSAPTSGKAALTKLSPPFNFRSTVSKTLSQDATTTLVAIPSNIPIPDAINTSVDPT